MGKNQTPYSPLKVFHHQDRLADLRAGHQIVPTQVQLILSDLCNQDCSFCAYRMSGYTASELFTAGAELAVVGTNNPKRMIETPKAMEILDDCAVMGVNAVQFTGGGEPTVHPDFDAIYDSCHARGLHTALVTNGLLMGKHIPLVVRSSWVRVSIDAGCAESYATIRRVDASQFEKVWANVAALVEAKQAGNHDGLVIGIGFVVTKENWREVGSCIRRAKEVGVDNVRISAVFQPDDAAYFDDFYDTASRECKQLAERYTTDSFKVFNLFGDRVSDLVEASPDYEFCGYQQFNTYIGGDLNVYRCCVQSYSTHGLVGSLKDQRLSELWESEEKLRDFGNFDARSCDRCQFNTKNRTILYALEDDPMHVDFV
jgi:MoaA/NifB/PqqE/SkfB family radical SAM enzyme